MSKSIREYHTRRTAELNNLGVAIPNDLDRIGFLLDQKEALEKIYNAVNLMLNELGAAGSITTMHDTVSDVMDTLHDFDGGVYTRIDLEQPELFTRVNENAEPGTPEYRKNFVKINANYASMGLDLKMVNVGQLPSDETGDTIRDGWIKVNDNFAQIETAIFNSI